jgi:hypothetical protein
MMRHLLIALAVAALVGTSMIPDEALAYRGGARGVRAGAVGVRGTRGYGYRPIPGRPVARAAVRGAAWRGAAWGAAGAAAVGAGYYYGNGSSSCYRDAYGQVVCPYQNQY